MSQLLVQIRIPARRSYMLALLESLIAINRIWLRETRGSLVGGASPSLYDRRVRYQRETRDPVTGQRIEQWKPIYALIRDGVGDCEDLASARVAELRERGINAKPYLTNNKKLWHVRVRMPDGTIEDPSARLGMRGSA